MSLDPKLLEDIELLMLFDNRNPMEGLKVHQEAEDGKIAAAKHLHDLGITTLSDGGYLTDRGREAADLAERLVNILQARSAS